MGYIVTFLLGFLLSGVWFGCHIFIRQQIARKELAKLDMFSPLLSAIIPTVIIFLITQTHPFHVSAIKNYKLWIIAITTVFVVSLIKIMLSHTEAVTETDGTISSKCMEAALMEIPQRTMMQTFLCLMLSYGGLDIVWGIFINACVWVLDIVVQAYIFRQRNYYEIVVDILASFVFSVGIGYVYFVSEFIVISMSAHALERYIVTKVKSRK